MVTLWVMEIREGGDWVPFFGDDSYLTSVNEEYAREELQSWKESDPLGTFRLAEYRRATP